MKVAETITETVQRISLTTSIGTSTATASVAVAEQAGFLAWVDKWALAVGLGISLFSALVHFASVIINIRVKAATAKAEAIQRKKKRSA